MDMLTLVCRAANELGEHLGILNEVDIEYRVWDSNAPHGLAGELFMTLTTTGTYAGGKWA